MTYAPVPPVVLERALARLADEVGLTRAELLEALLPIVLEWAIDRTAADLNVTTREARARIARMIDRTV